MNSSPVRSSHRRSAGWVWLLGLFFLLVIFDGALRKWVLPSRALLLFVLKDGVLAGAFVLYWMSGRPVRLLGPVRHTFFASALVAYIGVVCLQALNFAQPHWAIRILGLKAHLAYVPLVVLVPALLDSLRTGATERILAIYMGLVVLPVLALGMYQFFQPPQSWINTYVAETAHVSTVAGNPRVTGTFSYISGMSSFVVFHTLFGFGALVAGFLKARRTLVWCGAVVLGGCAIVAPMTGARSTVYLSALLTAGISILLLVRKREFSSLAWRVLLVGGGVLALASQTNLGQGWFSFQERVESTTDAERRVETTIESPLVGLGAAGLLGYGVGSTHQAASRVAPVRATGAPNYENKAVRVVLELGFAGYLVWLAMKLSLAWLAFQVFDHARSTLGFIAGVTGLGVSVWSIVFPVMFNVTTAAFYWTAVGLVVYEWSRQKARQKTRTTMEGEYQ